MQVTASGAADIEQGRAITATTVFHIASLSKQITAAVLAQAILDGAVDLADPISRYVPQTAQYGPDLTIAHLVYMTSGLTEYYTIDRPGAAPWSTFHYFTVSDAIRASLSVPTLSFPPGTRWQYSNINYMLLTRVAEKALKRPFSTLAQERIFSPLGMSATLINDDITQIIPNRANAYTARTQERLQELRDYSRITVDDAGGLVMIRRNAPHYGGSGVMTSIADWSLWLQDFMTQDRLGEAFWTLMLRTQTFDHDKANDALGLVLSSRHDQPMIWYEGGDIDASSFMAVFPDAGRAVTCFANDPNGRCSTKALAVADRLHALGALSPAE